MSMERFVPASLKREADRRGTEHVLQAGVWVGFTEGLHLELGLAFVL